MPTRQELRAEETKRSILSAAGELFRSRGYDAVTMREIAKEAGCSHTTIYIYFKDKEALLHHLSMPPLLTLMKQFDDILNEDLCPDEKLIGISLSFIRFCLTHRNMYTIFFNVKAVRVDEQNPELEINQIRNQLFAKLSDTLKKSLELAEHDERLLTISRIYFFTLHGVVATYTFSEETVDMLMDRLSQVFRETFEVLLLGFKSKQA
jgi:AcrR family transcriptional regulator